MTIYCDAHIHLFHAKEPVFDKNEQYLCVTSCHSKEEFESSGRFSQAVCEQPSCEPGYPHFRCSLHSSAALRNASGGATIPTATTSCRDEFSEENSRSTASVPHPCGGFAGHNAFFSYGFHPQIVTPSYLKNDFPTELSYLENLLSEKKIVAVGECGFDFFTPEFKSTASEQEIVFNEQLKLAQKYGVPLVLHLRKSIEKIFTYSRELKKLPSVIFHSFPGTLREAESLKKHGINAFFSFGKPILNGKKSAIDCVQNLPIQTLLFETDAPYQTLKDEKETLPSDLKKVYQRACILRKTNLEELSDSIFETFKQAYSLQ